MFGWKPYMHNPRLKRWLHRIDIPTLLLWGAQDGIVTPAYGEAWRAEIPGARMEVIPRPATSRTGNSREASPTGFRRFVRNQLRRRADALLVFLRNGVSSGVGSRA